jgi:hypothetical protein
MTRPARLELEMEEGKVRLVAGLPELDGRVDEGRRPGEAVVDS